MTRMRILSVVALSLVSTAALADNPHDNTIANRAVGGQTVPCQVAFSYDSDGATQPGLCTITYDQDNGIAFRHHR